jgi:hypothetical protein
MGHAKQCPGALVKHTKNENKKKLNIEKTIFYILNV